MKQLKLSFLLTILISMLGTMSFAYDIEVKNEDGIIIYYNYIKDGQELEVVPRAVGCKWRLPVSHTNHYGDIYEERENIYCSIGYEDIETLKIPAEITFGERTLKVTSIGDYAFACYSSGMILPNGEIETSEGGPKISNLYVPETITHIGKDAFCYWSHGPVSAWVNGTYIYPYYTLRKFFSSIGIIYRINSLEQWIVNGGNITGANTYRLSNYECDEITDIVIPESSQSLSMNLFKGCSSLKSVTLPNNMSYIGSGAFDCENLTTVISLMKDPVEIYSVFSENTIVNGTLYVPKGTKSKYESTKGWKDFVHIKEGMPAKINIVENTKDNKTVIYDLNGVRLSEPKKGINIINGKKYVRK